MSYKWYRRRKTVAPIEIYYCRCAPCQGEHRRGRWTRTIWQCNICDVGGHLHSYLAAKAQAIEHLRSDQHVRTMLNDRFPSFGRTTINK